MSIKKMAANPQGALRELEKALGVDADRLLKQMHSLSDEAWEKHIPYSVAARYFDDVALQVGYRDHVDTCGYCQMLLDTLHPPQELVEQFSANASTSAAMPVRTGMSGSGFRGAALAASFAVVAMVGILAVAFRGSDEKQTLAAVNELGTDPGLLARLETSPDPAERFRAAKLYFELQQPQFAYQQLADGLAISGASATDVKPVEKAAQASNTVSSRESLEAAAHRLAELESKKVRIDEAEYLELAQLQAKLGLHRAALDSIQSYLKARDTDPKFVAEYSRATKVITAYDAPSFNR